MSRLFILVLLVVGLATSDVIAQNGNGQVSETPENLSRVAYNEGLELVRAEQFNEARAKFEEGIEIYEGNPRNHYMLALVTRREGNVQESIDLYMRAAEIAEESGDSQLAEMAVNNAARGYVVLAARELQNERPRPAVELLDQAGEISEPDADTHFYYARALNQLGQYERAVEHAQQGVEMETGGRTARAKIYFELGMAYKNLGDNESARQAFEEAAVGEYRRAAEYELEYLD